MKRILGVILAMVLLVGGSMNVFASHSENEGNFRITEDTSLGDVMRNTDPETYYSFSEEQQNIINSINFKELEQTGEASYTASNSKSRAWSPTFGAALSTDQYSPSKGVLSYSGTIDATQACPSLYLSAIAYDSNGYVVSEMANTRKGSRTVSVANVKHNLKSGGRYHVTYYGLIQAPAGLTPPSGVVSSTKYITLK